MEKITLKHYQFLQSLHSVPKTEEERETLYELIRFVGEVTAQNEENERKDAAFDAELEEFKKEHEEWLNNSPLILFDPLSGWLE